MLRGPFFRAHSVVCYLKYVPVPGGTSPGVFKVVSETVVLVATEMTPMMTLMMMMMIRDGD